MLKNFNPSNIVKLGLKCQELLFTWKFGTMPLKITKISIKNIRLGFKFCMFGHRKVYSGVKHTKNRG